MGRRLRPRLTVRVRVNESLCILGVYSGIGRISGDRFEIRGFSVDDEWASISSTSIEKAGQVLRLVTYKALSRELRGAHHSPRQALDPCMCFGTNRIVGLKGCQVQSLLRRLIRPSALPRSCHCQCRPVYADLMRLGGLSSLEDAQRRVRTPW